MKKFTKAVYHWLTLLIISLLSVSAWSRSTAIVIPAVSLTSQVNTTEKRPVSLQTTRINRQVIADAPVVNLVELLRQQQSVVRIQASSGDPSQSAMSLRGFGDNAAANALILVDGFPLTNPSLLAPNFNAIPLTDIDHIDIIQGSQGTLWGDQAVGGVVSITTRHPKHVYLNTLSSLGSYDKTYLNLTAGNHFTNGVFAKAYGVGAKADNYRAHNQSLDGNVSATLGWDYALGTSSITLQSESSTMDFPGGLSLEQFNDNPQQATNFSNYSHYNTQNVQLLNQHMLGSDWSVETRVLTHRTLSQGFIFANFQRNDSLQRLSPRVQGSIHHVKITAGYDGQLSQYHLSQRQTLTRADAAQQALFLEAKIPVTAQWDLTLGGRIASQRNAVTSFTDFTHTTTTRVAVTEQGITYHPSALISFFARRDGNFSFPKANESTLVPLTVASLSVQKGTSYEMGSEWWLKRHHGQLNLYRLDLMNEIAFNPAQTASQPFGAFTNLDPTRRYGVTITEDVSVSPQLRVNAQLNVVNARFVSGMYNGKRIPAVPAVTSNLGVIYDVASQWSLRYAALYTSSRIASEDVKNNGKAVPAYWLHSTAIEYRYQMVSVSFEVENVFNQAFSTYTYYNPTIKTTTYYPGAGRSYLLSLKVNMG